VELELLCFQLNAVRNAAAAHAQKIVTVGKAENLAVQVLADKCIT